MAKGIILIDEVPKTCLECPFKKDELMYIGDFTYKQLYKCFYTPDDVYDVYLADIMNAKPEWCPIKEVLVDEFKA